MLCINHMLTQMITTYPGVVSDMDLRPPYGVRACFQQWGPFRPKLYGVLLDHHTLYWVPTDHHTLYGSQPTITLYISMRLDLCHACTIYKFPPIILISN